MRRGGIRHTGKKSDLTEFAKWIGGMHSTVDPELVAIYNRGVILKAFPGYTMQSLKRAPARDLYVALELMETARKVHQSDG